MPAIALRALSLLIGVFLFFMGIDKLGWFTDGGAFLARRFAEWVMSVPAASRWFLETIAIPGTPLFAKLVPIGELATGAALIVGFRIRIAATIALLMVLTFHFASGVIFLFAYLTNPYGLPVVGALLALALGGQALPFAYARRS